MVLKVVSPKDKYKDNEIYRDIVTYCLDPLKTPHCLVTGFNLDVDHIPDDMYELAERFKKLKGTRIRHSVLSFDPIKEHHISVLDAFHIAEKSCMYYASDYQIFAAVHEDADHIHVHMVMNTVRICDGEKYKGRKKDYYDFQKYLKNAIRPMGLKLKTKLDD